MTSEHVPSGGESYEQQDLGRSRAEIASEAATIAIIGSESPVASWPYAQAAANTAAKEKEAADKRGIELQKALEDDALSLADLNPLTHQVDLERKESVDAVRYAIYKNIEQYGGIPPTALESGVVSNGKEEALRFIARFEVPSMTQNQMKLLEELVNQTYGLSVRATKTSEGTPIAAGIYPPIQPTENIDFTTSGWYMGPAPQPNSTLHQGLLMYRDLGPVDPDNFPDEVIKPRRFIVEIREASQYQTDLVTFVTQTSAILGQEKMLDRGQLLYDTYYDLIRRGLKERKSGASYGMEEATDMIMRELILPLANPEISKGVKTEPQSGLLVGVPGTGKTLVVEELLQRDTGVFILPIDPIELQNEIALPPEKQRLMPRIAAIAKITGKQLVLHAEDLENMLGANSVTNSTMLNIMAGVRESGFHIIASTNYPERINPSLLQPGRFSMLIYCGLQDENARREILKIHANMQSEKLQHPLFKSEEIRELILNQVAERTDGFTPRFLSNIVTVAKSHLIARVAKEAGKTVGLTEEDLDGHIFTAEDWAKAFAQVDGKFDSRKMKAEDKRMAEFVKKHAQDKEIGFQFPQTETSSRQVFSSAFFAQLAAAEAHLNQAQNLSHNSTDNS